MGFNKISFPIIIKDGGDIDIIYELKDFALDSDYYLHEFDNRLMFLIDGNGQVWSWKYDLVNRTNLPDKLKQTLSFEEVKKLIENYYRGSKIEVEMKGVIRNVSTIRKLIDAIADKL